LFTEDNLSQILDPQVMQEGGKEVGEVATLAVACLKLTAEDRPTMRQVELTLESLQLPKQLPNVVLGKFDNNDHFAMMSSSSKGRIISEESTRQYSMEKEFELSERYPR
jgi:hypothetical protein